MVKLYVSNETANQLLNGKFEAFEEIESSVLDPNFSNVEILYKEILNKNKDSYDYFIETIFINE